MPVSANAFCSVGHKRSAALTEKSPHICYANTACGTKNKTHTDESRHGKR